MKLFYSDRQLAHQPRQYMVHGKIIGAFENNDRATTLIGALAEAGLTPEEPASHGLGPIRVVLTVFPFHPFRHSAFEEPSVLNRDRGHG